MIFSFAFKLQDDIAQQHKEGNISLSPNEDILSHTLGPDHGGWVRGKGYGMTPSKFFNAPRRNQQQDLISLLLENERKKRDEERDMWASRFAVMEAEIAALKASQNLKSEQSFSGQNYQKVDHVEV